MSKVTEVKFYCDNEECKKELTDTRIFLYHIVVEYNGEVETINDDANMDGLEFCSIECLKTVIQKILFKLRSLS